MTTTETPAEALARIQSTVSKNDFAAIVQFANCGIDVDDILPRVNVLTFKAWKALGRMVARGATGQRVTVWVPVNDKKTGKPDGVRPITAVLFHVSQTIAETADKGTKPAAWQNPALVKAGTYDEAAGTEPETETDTTDNTQAVTPEPALDIIDVEYTTEPLRLTYTPPQRRIEGPKTPARRQLAMF